MKVFTYNEHTNSVEIEEPALLLIKEFKDLFGTERNKCAEDPGGTRKLRAFREFTYIWLMLDWKSPYADDGEQQRHKEVMADAGLTEEEFDDPLFRAACRKYRELQESSTVMKLYLAVQNMTTKFIDYFNSVDPTERDAMTGKPIFKVKDIMQEISLLPELKDKLKAFEEEVKKEMKGSDDNSFGDIEAGFNDE